MVKLVYLWYMKPIKKYIVDDDLITISTNHIKVNVNNKLFIIFTNLCYNINRIDMFSLQLGENIFLLKIYLLNRIYKSILF
ncbi:MAG: hypothetical protein K0Q49_2233 [Haloplasmataceae bacterium]|jgi:hypothetical protein|nr:hypothetical protein [Haloplasmataceae bacterium]